MNLVKAADDLKNLSDQQLMMAGQNPVVVPPYLVLAEMKRREQLRAEYAKSAQAQQQPTVMQQVTQNLVQQPQQQQPQQQQQPPQAQGIMQAAPPQVAAMAGGGHVARYAEGTKGYTLRPGYQAVMDAIRAIPRPTQQDVVPSGPMTSEEFAKLYKFPTVQEKLAQAESILGRQDYSEYQKYLDEQRQEAEGRKVRLGDALIAAGAAMASNRDNRVGLASLLAQGIGAGSEAYRSAQERKKKDIQAAMLANMALKNMMQQERAKQIQLASDLSSQERGQKVVEAQTIEANRRQYQDNLRKAREQAESQEIQMALKAAGILQAQASADDTARLASLRNPFGRSSATTQREQKLEEARGLAFDASLLSREYLSQKGLSGELDFLDLAINNLRNPNYFKDRDSSQKLIAISLLEDEKKKRQAMIIQQRLADLKEKKANPSSMDLLRGGPAATPPLPSDEELAVRFGGSQ